MQSCTSDISTDEQDHTEAKDDSKGAVAAIGDAEEDDDDKPILPIEPVVAPVAPVAPAAPDALLPPPAPLSPWGGGGGGGGRGNSDIEREHHHPEEPHGRCGDGKQEVLPDSHECKYRLFGSTNNDNGTISLYGFHLRDNGEGKLIGNVSGGLSKIYALDFDPSGRLYGLGVRTSDSAIVYFSLDCQTAEATILGNTELTTSLLVTDMDFDSIGRLFAYVNEGSSPDQLGIIVHVLHVPTTGEYIELGVTGLDDELGNAIASTPFPIDPLYHAGDASGITILSKATGLASSPIATISFPNSVSGLSPFINSMDGDPFTNIVYVSFQDSDNDFFVAILDVYTGAVTFLSDDEHTAPSNLNTITVNRRYEECDFRATTPPLPPGTSCTDECQVIETDCSDGIDNDQNGLIDCADPACNHQPCDPHNGCVRDATCVEGECVGTDFNPCVDIIGNECTITTCVPIPDDDDDFYCTYQLDPTKTTFGSCTPNDNCAPDSRNPDGSCNDVLSQCELGKCVAEEICPVDGEENIVCEGQNRNTIPVGICSSTLEICTDVVNSTDCSEGTCVAQGTADQPGCLDDNPCTADSCLEDAGCEYETLLNVLCDNGDPCIINLCQIVDGTPTCVNTGGLLAEGTACDTGNQCSTGACNGDGSCEVTGHVENGTPCSNAFGPCTNSTGTCQGGICVASIQYTSCIFNSDCPLSGACICEAGAGDVASPEFGCFSEGTCACADTPCFYCAGGSSSANPSCESRTSGSCLEGCNLGVCNDEAQCGIELRDPSYCSVGECSDTTCIASTCTGENTCETVFATGALNCSVEITVDDTELICDGFVACLNGLAQGTCIGGDDNGEPCYANDDCDSNNCDLPGTCPDGTTCNVNNNTCGDVCAPCVISLDTCAEK